MTAARRALLLSAIVPAFAALSGCSLYDRIFGIGGSTRLLQIQSISLLSDHPVNAAVPTGDAVLGSTGTIRFTAMGTFLVVGTTTLTTSDVSSAVVWESSAPQIALPGADGKVMAHGSSGV